MDLLKVILLIQLVNFSLAAPLSDEASYESGVSDAKAAMKLHEKRIKIMDFYSMIKTLPVGFQFPLPSSNSNSISIPDSAPQPTMSEQKRGSRPHQSATQSS